MKREKQMPRPLSMPLVPFGKPWKEKEMCMSVSLINSLATGPRVLSKTPPIILKT